MTAARCRHFGTCGGCALQDLPYDGQLARKKAGLEGLLARWWNDDIRIHASPSPWHYRNKMEFAFGRLGHKEPLPALPGERGGRYEYVLDGTVLGLKEKGRWDKTLDLQECFLLSPETPALLASVRAWVGREKLEGYDAKSARGFLRHLLVREAKGTGQRMVMALAGEGAFPGDSFLKAVKDAYPATTVLHGVNRSPSDVARAEEVRVLEGPGYIEEELAVQRPLRFRISPFSFFQTNSKGTEVLYRLIRDFVSPSPSPLPTGEVGRRPGEGLLLDLYGGAGGIAFSLHDLFERVVSVENNPSATEDGRHNAALNAISNVDFVCAPVEKYLLDSALRLPDSAFVVLDPPRAGIHPKALKAVIAARPRTIVYVSCNPKAFALDMQALSSAYRTVRLEAVDLFPHTEHVEAVARLELV